MEQFDALQALWKRHGSRDASGLLAGALAARLKRYGRYELSIGMLKIGLVSAAVVPAVWWLLRARPASPVMTAGVLWSAAAIGALVILQWREQRALARLDYAAPSAEFINAAIDTLERVQSSAVTHAQFLAGALIIGLNAIAWGSAVPAGPLARTLVHAACTLLPLGAYRVGVAVRRGRAEKALGPLLRQLRQIRDQD